MWAEMSYNKYTQSWTDELEPDGNELLEYTVKDEEYEPIQPDLFICHRNRCVL